MKTTLEFCNWSLEEPSSQALFRISVDIWLHFGSLRHACFSQVQYSPYSHNKVAHLPLRLRRRKFLKTPGSRNLERCLPINTHRAPPYFHFHESYINRIRILSVWVMECYFPLWKEIFLLWKRRVRYVKERCQSASSPEDTVWQKLRGFVPDLYLLGWHWQLWFISTSGNRWALFFTWACDTKEHWNVDVLSEQQMRSAATLFWGKPSWHSGTISKNRCAQSSIWIPSTWQCREQNTKFLHSPIVGKAVPVLGDIQTTIRLVTHCMAPCVWAIGSEG